MTEWLLWAGLSAALSEFCANRVVNSLRKDFQWLITAKDKRPKLDINGLKKFWAYSFDPELGWVRQPNSGGEETKGSVGAVAGHDNRSSFNINSRGARNNPGHEDLPRTISTYGDSFAFCRQVNDDQTWQWYLSRLTRTNVLNFGVGNYGLDQGLLRLKREYEGNKTEIVLLAVVPETIVRILNVWKHYFEYGNTFGFKPRFFLSENGLRLFRNPVDTEDKFINLEKYLPEIQEADYFYKAKFKKDMITFPYILSLFRSPRRNIPLIYTLLMRRVLRKVGKQYDRPWEIILKENKRCCISLYRNKSAVDLMIAILKEFLDFGKEKGFIPVFVLLPYQADVEYTRKKGVIYYEEFVRRASDIVRTIDTMPGLLEVNESIYINDYYGGHLNECGNEIVASILYEQLRSIN